MLWRWKFSHHFRGKAMTFEVSDLFVGPYRRLYDERVKKIERFVEKLSKFYNVNPPTVVLRKGPSMSYLPLRKTIVVGEESISLRLLLHEFRHHMQWEKELFPFKILIGWPTDEPIQRDAAEWAGKEFGRWVDEWTKMGFGPW